MNKTILIGRLGKTPELKYTQDGTAVASFGLATSERWKDKNGEKKERTEWHRITAYGKLAELCTSYLEKGSQVFIEGRIHYREWDDKENIKHNMTDIVVTGLEFLGSKKRGDDKQQADGPQEDVPF